jgi:hypothetical protein
MPSYIVIDKNNSCPSAPNSNKVVFGVNSSGDPVTVDNSGNVTVIGSGGNTPPVPCAGDYVEYHSYSNWIQGTSGFGAGNDIDKFTSLAENNDPGDYLNLELVAGQVNGINITSCNPYTLNVTSSDVNYRDDGFGTYATNYVDFLNGVFANHSLYTRFTGSGNYFDKPNNLVVNYCKVDNFTFIFKETGVLTPSSISSPFFYAIKSENGASIKDSINSSELEASNNLNTGNVWSYVVIA